MPSKLYEAILNEWGVPMSQQIDLTLINRIRSNDDPMAKEELVKKYWPMIHHIVKNKNSAGIDYEDYLQEGAIGLLKAIEEYDPEHYPIKFSTFAYICILRRIYNTLKRAIGRKASFSAQTISLYTNSGDDESRLMIDLLAANDYEPFSQVEEHWIGQKIDLILLTYLSQVEYQVVKMILQGYSFQEIKQCLALPAKVIDNARTRAKVKLKRVVFQYGSLLNPQIPMKIRKRKDLAIQLEVG